MQIDFTSMTEKITQDDQVIQGSKTQPGGNNLDDNFYKKKKSQKEYDENNLLSNNPLK